MKNRTRKNFSYQTVYQIIITVAPLITAPYLSRVLGAELLGEYSFRLSIVSYFTLLAALGMTTYGTRTIAENAGNKEKKDQVFWQLSFVQFGTSIFVSALYILYCFLFAYHDLFSWVFCITMVSYVFDFNWYFYGVQKFKITAIVNSMTRVLSVVLILCLVKQKEDVFIYAIIMSCTTFFSFAALIPFLIKEISKKTFQKPEKKQILFHFKNDIILFIPILAQTIYHVMDKTMLGAISSFEQSGYYYNADKLISIPIGLISGICLVMLPRMTELKRTNGNQSQKTFKTMMQLIACVSSALCFGIISISNDFVPLFFGKEYASCIELVNALAVVIIFKAMTEGLKTQYLVPNSANFCFIFSVFLGAFVNLVINFCLIPTNGAMGAVIGTVLAELTVLLVQGLFVIRKTNTLNDIPYLIGFCFNGFLMYLAIFRIQKLLSLSVLRVVISICSGIIIYSLLTLLYCQLTRKKEFSGMVLKYLRIRND